MKTVIYKLVIEAIKDLYNLEVEPSVKSCKDTRHGDYTTNIAMQIAKELGKDPLIIASEIVNTLEARKYILINNYGQTIQNKTY